MTTKAEREYQRVKKKSKPGEGKRFKALTKALKSKGAKNPRALAAWIGRKKYGKKRFQQMAASGKRKARHYLGHKGETDKEIIY